MTKTAIVEILKTHLAKEGLVLCRSNDTTFALDGFKEYDALTSIIELVEDTQAVAEWDADKTTPIPADVLSALAKAS